MFKKTTALIISFLLVTTMFVGCGEKETETTSKGEKGAPQEVKFWYLWSGEDAKTLEKIIANYNNSQDRYLVKGLSQPDEQKLITSISSGTGPDISDTFSNKIASYASKGILQPLDDYIKKDNYIEDFVPATIDTVKYDGKIYGLPAGAGEGLMMFYNKKLLKEAGFNEPPKTDKELMDVATKATKLDKDGNMEALGFPDFPFVYYATNMTFALGGDLISEDGKELTPDNEATIKALHMIADYRKKFGIEKIDKFNASNGAYVAPTDCFITGHQALRFDGMWLVGLINKYNPDLEYGIAMLPYPEGHPELAGGGEASSSVLYIPSNAKNKEGAWDFLKYIEGTEGMKLWAKESGFIPARKSLWTDPEIEKIPGFKQFSEKVAKNNTKVFPSFPAQAEYSTQLATYYELAANSKLTPEEAMKECKEKCKDLLNQK